MNITEAAQIALDEILEIGRLQTESPPARMANVARTALLYHLAALGWLVTNMTKFVVPYGPFVGMRCNNEFAGNCNVPMLIRSYEAELHDTIQELVRRSYERVVNIGCGEGYYAVGLARLLPAAHIFALDIDPAAQALCKSLAELNEVAERITIAGKCTPAVLQELAQPGTLIFCDCEGEELELLDPVSVPVLSQCDILVEMHDYLRPQVSATLDIRFRPTHTTRVIPQVPRDPLAYPILESFGEYDRMLSLCEHRPGYTPWGLFVQKRELHI